MGRRGEARTGSERPRGAVRWRPACRAGRDDRRVVVGRAAGGGPEDGSGGNQGGDDDRRDPDSEAGEVESRWPDDVVGWGGAGFGGHVVVVPSVLVVSDDEQALLPGGLVVAQCRVDVVDELFAHGQIRDRMLVILYLKVVFVVGLGGIRRVVSPGILGPFGLDVAEGRQLPAGGVALEVLDPGLNMHPGPGWMVSGKSFAVTG